MTDEQAAIHENLIRETPAMRLGLRLRRARLARNLTQGEVAKNLFSVSYVSAVERGQIRPSLGALEKLAERLNVPVTELLGNGDLSGYVDTTPSAAREAAQDRAREEVENRIREAQKLIRQGTSRSVGQAIDLLLRLAGQQLTQRELARLEWLLAQSYYAQGRGEDARRAAQDGLAITDRLGDTDLTERLRFELGNALALLGNPALAQDQYKRNLHAIDQGYMPDLAFQIGVLSNYGNLLWQMGEHEEAHQFLARAVQLSREMLNLERIAEIYWALAQTQANRGNNAEARQYAYKSIAAYEEVANRRLVAGLYQLLGRTYTESGNAAEAVANLRMASEIASAQQDARSFAESQRALSAALLGDRRLDEAASAAEQAVQQAVELDDALQHAESLLMLARVREEQGRKEDAERGFSEAIELLKAHDAGEALGEAYAEFSKFLERRGDSKRAFEMLKAAYSASTPTGAKI